MRARNLKRYLHLWQQAGLIDEAQVKKISDYMNVEWHRQFLRLIQVLFIVGAFWLFVGLLATLRLINMKILVVIGRLLYDLVSPLICVVRYLSPDHYRDWLSGIACVAGWGLCHWLGMKIRRRSDTQILELGAFQEPELRLGTVAFTIGYILLSWGLQHFNYAIYPREPYRYLGEAAIFPVFSLVGTGLFFSIAYLMKDQIALLFGIGFLGHLVGLVTMYFTACYVIGVQIPVIQLLVGILLVFVGLYHIEKVRGREDDYRFKFGRTYEWTGLIFAFLSLWIMSIWGFTFSGHYWIHRQATELWLANILFMGGSLLTLFYGAAAEDRMFFNFGLTFLIIDSYTLFFSYAWSTFGSALGSLLLGVMLIATGYILRGLWLKGRIMRKPVMNG